MEKLPFRESQGFFTPAPSKPGNTTSTSMSGAHKFENTIRHVPFSNNSGNKAPVHPPFGTMPGVHNAANGNRLSSLIEENMKLLQTLSENGTDIGGKDMFQIAFNLMDTPNGVPPPSSQAPGRFWHGRWEHDPCISLRPLPSRCLHVAVPT